MNIAQIEQRFRPTADGKCAEAPDGMVATAFPEATLAGVEMLQHGGNAADAACAAALALSVCEPQASGLGGQSMAILQMGGKAVAINGSGRIPSLAHASRFRADDLTTGYRSTTVPSTVAVLGHIQRTYGILPWAAVVAPAMAIAEQGYQITPLQHGLQQREWSNFQQVASRSGARYFLKHGAEPYQVGDLFRQPDLATVLKTIARDGPEAFYQGTLARMIDADMRRHGGFLRADDLAYIPWPVTRAPLSAEYDGITVLTMPPPAPGRILLVLLRLMHRWRQRTCSHSVIQDTRFFIEALRHVLREHGCHPVRADLYDPQSDPLVTDEGSCDGLLTAIEQAMTPSEEPPGKALQGGETTHLSVMDREGNAVGITQSVNLVYGAKAAADGLGFLYNNYLADSILDQPAHPYFLRPNGMPVSTVCPTIVLYEGTPWIVAGSPGSERILSTVAQFLGHIVHESLPIDEAMRLPRLHCSAQGVLSLEFERFAPGVREALLQAGYEIIRRAPYAFYHGAIHAVLKRQTGPGFQGVAEIRRDGIAKGCEVIS